MYYADTLDLTTCLHRLVRCFLVSPVALAQQGGDSTMERITNAREKCSVESRTGLTT